MDRTNPDSNRTGVITLSCDETGTSVKHTEMELQVIAHLFYHALIGIPNAFIAMQMALERYNKDNKN